MALEPVALRTARGEFHALAAGDPGAPVVLLCHGFPDVPGTFAPVIELLARGGLRAVAPYMRGYAPSPLEGPFDAASLAGDIAAMAGALSPGPITLVGHDWGAVASYWALARSPASFSAAVLLSVPHPLAFLAALARSPAQARRSWYMAFFQPPGLAERAVPRDHFALIDRLWRDWSPGLTPPPGHLDEVKRCLARSMPAPVAYYRALLRPLVASARSARLLHRARIAAPTLHLTGADDGCIGPGAGAGQERYFSGEFSSEVVERAGHFLPLERPGLVAERVLSLSLRRRGG